MKVQTTKLISKKVLELVNGNKGDVLISQYEIPFEVIKSGLEKAKSLGMITLNPAPSRYLDTTIYKYVDYLIKSNRMYYQVYQNIEDVKHILNFFEGIHKLINDGVKGSIYKSKCEVSAYKVKAIDSTGAGDLMLVDCWHS